eukprot:jgi/Botrbrau1/7254/Bobra.0021s0036.1
MHTRACAGMHGRTSVHRPACKHAGRHGRGCVQAHVDDIMEVGSKSESLGLSKVAVITVFFHFLQSQPQRAEMASYRTLVNLRASMQ